VISKLKAKTKRIAFTPKSLPSCAQGIAPQAVAASRSVKLAGSWDMLRLTCRRDHNARQESWRIYYGDIRVGAIGKLAGLPPEGQSVGMVVRVLSWS
jgi:hypothetical protein